MTASIDMTEASMEEAKEAMRALKADLKAANTALESAQDGKFAVQARLKASEVRGRRARCSRRRLRALRHVARDTACMHVITYVKGARGQWSRAGCRCAFTVAAVQSALVCNMASRVPRQSKTHLQAEARALNAQISKLETRAATARDEQERREQDAQQLRQDLASAREALDGAREERRAAEARSSEARQAAAAEAAELRGQIDALQAKLAAVEGDVEAARAALAAVRARASSVWLCDGLPEWGLRQQLHRSRGTAATSWRVRAVAARGGGRHRGRPGAGHAPRCHGGRLAACARLECGRQRNPCGLRSLATVGVAGGRAGVALRKQAREPAAR